MNRASPFVRRYAEAARMGRHAALHAAPGTARLNFRGGARFKYPLVALMVVKDLGNCRHALSRRVVAGTMTVHFAFEKTASST